MTRTHGVLDYGPPPRKRLDRLGRAISAFAALAACTVIGALLGALMRPTYLARGILQINPPHPLSKAVLAMPQLQTLAIVKAALPPARQLPAGASLPASPTAAFSHAQASSHFRRRSLPGIQPLWPTRR
jgi:hypothetical protein